MRVGTSARQARTSAMADRKPPVPTQTTPLTTRPGKARPAKPRPNQPSSKPATDRPSVTQQQAPRKPQQSAPDQVAPRRAPAPPPSTVGAAGGTIRGIDSSKITSGKELIDALRPTLERSRYGREALRDIERNGVRVKIAEDLGAAAGMYRPATNTITVERESIDEASVDDRRLAGLIVHEARHARDSNRDGSVLAPGTHLLPGRVGGVVRGFLGAAATAYVRGPAGAVIGSVTNAARGKDPMDGAIDGYNRARTSSEVNAYTDEERFLADVGVHRSNTRVHDHDGKEHDPSTIHDNIVAGDLYAPGILDKTLGGVVGAALFPATTPIMAASKGQEMLGRLF